MITKEEFMKLEQERNSRIDQRQRDCQTRLAEEVDRVIRENWTYAKSGRVNFVMKNFRFDELEIRAAMCYVNDVLRKNGVHVNVLLNDTTYKDYPDVYFRVCK